MTSSFKVNDALTRQAELEQLREAREVGAPKVARFTLANLQVLAYVDDVYDGDTAQLCFRTQSLGMFRWTCRMARIAALEMRSDSSADRIKAVAARDYLRSLILRKLVAVRILGEEKYHRPLVEIYLYDRVDISGQVHGLRNVNDMMLEKGHAVLYQ